MRARRVGTRGYALALAGLALLAAVAVVARRADAGVLLRTVPIGPGPIGAFSNAVVVAAGAGHVFVANGNNGTVSMLDADSGRLLHTATVSPSPSDPVVADERIGRVYVLDSQNPDVSVLDARNGALLNTVTLVSDPVAEYQSIGSPVVDARTGRLFITRFGGADGKGYVVVLDARTGTLLRTVPVGRFAVAAALDERTGRLFVLNQEHRDSRCICFPVGPGSVSVLDARDGRVLRMVAVGTGPGAAAVDVATDRVFVVDQPRAGNGSLSVLDARDGRVLRTAPLGRSPGPPVVDARAGYLLVPDVRGVGVYGARDGRPLRMVPIAADRRGNPATVMAVDERRRRAVAANGSGAYLLDVRGGKVIRAYPGMDGVAALDERTGRVVVTAIGPRYPQGMGNPTGNGTASILDDESGAILRTVVVGLRPGLAALDGRTGRAFVVNVGCPAPRLPCGPPRAPDPLGWAPAWLRRLMPWRAAAPDARGATVSVLDTRR